MKRIVAVGAAIFLTLALIQAYRYTIGAKVIGTVDGLEWDQITIEDRIYKIDHSSHFSSADKGDFLGIAISGDNSFRIYGVKGDDEGQYIYRLWDWEGAFYKLVE